MCSKRKICLLKRFLSFVLRFAHRSPFKPGSHIWRLSVAIESFSCSRAAAFMRRARSLTSGMYSAPRGLEPIRPRRGVLKIDLFMGLYFVFGNVGFTLAIRSVLNGDIQTGA